MSKTLKGCSCAVIVAVCLILYMIFFRVSSKTYLFHGSRKPNPKPEAAVAEMQFESHTCGLHSIRSVYRAYGLEPAEENLRARMGVDVNAIPTDDTSTGTLQPDMLRVLAQDGFSFELLAPEEPGTDQILTSHLGSGQMAMLLIARRENGNLHWVVCSQYKDGKLTILDSLFEQPYREPVDFFRSHVLTAVLVEPCEPPNCPTITKAHQAGIKDMARCKQRWDAIKAGAGH